MHPRRLRPDEEELWHRIARTARPLHPKGPFVDTAVPENKKHEPRKSIEQPIRLEPFEVGSRSLTAVSGLSLKSERIRPHSSASQSIDRNTCRRIKRGKEAPEARIDLHGMTADAALSALNAFLFRSHASRMRLVLVITGKGRTAQDQGPIPSRKGVLRKGVPVWLSRPPLSAIVLEVTEAHQRHGGAGAVYVFLRRSR